MKLLFYGRLADMLGRERYIAATGDLTVRALRRRLMIDHEHAKEELSERRARVCVADKLIDEDHLIGPNDTVEFLPPVSGG